MARIFPNPLSSDGVDRFNHKWMVLLFLVLSLASYIIPLHPSYHRHDQNNKAEMTSSESKSQSQSSASLTQRPNDPQPPNVGIQCWCPAQFTRNYIDYTHTICGKRYHAFLRGDDLNSEGINIDYNLHELIPVDRKGAMVERRNETLREFRKKREMAEKRNQEIGNLNAVRKANEEKLQGRVQKLVTYQTPILLLVLAICLALPQLIWDFLSDCFSPLSVGDTLEAANQSSRTDASNSTPPSKEISEAIAERLRSSTKTCSVLYLFKKVLSVLVLLVLIIVVAQYALPGVDNLEGDLKAIPSSYSASPAAGGLDEQTQNDGNDMSVHIPTRFLCDLSIRQLQRIETWTMMCEATNTDDIMKIQPGNQENKQSPLSNSNATPETSTTSTSQTNLLEFESTMLKIVIAFLVILEVGNVVSLCSWLCKLLCSSSRVSLGVSSNAATDIVFLAQMARINASAHVIQMLTGSSRDGFDKINLDEITDNQ